MTEPRIRSRPKLTAVRIAAYLWMFTLVPGSVWPVAFAMVRLIPEWTEFQFPSWLDSDNARVVLLGAIAIQTLLLIGAFIAFAASTAVRADRAMRWCVVWALIALAPMSLPFRMFEAPTLLVRPLHTSADGHWMARAAEIDSRLTLKLLLRRGVAIDARESNFGETALFAAVSRGYPDLVEWLLARGADIDATSRLGKTALFSAVALSDAEMVRRLVRHGANPHHVSVTGETIVDEAKRYNPAMLPLVLEIRGEKPKVKATR